MVKSFHQGFLNVKPKQCQKVNALYLRKMPFFHHLDSFLFYSYISTRHPIYLPTIYYIAAKKIPPEQSVTATALTPTVTVKVKMKKKCNHRA